MRFLFCSAQLPGHLDWGGYLLTAAELVRRGHAVAWASGAAVAPQVTAAGVPFVRLDETGWRWPPPPPLAPPANPNDPAWQLQRAERALDQWLDEARVAAATRDLHAVAQDFHPDLIVTETFVAAAGLVAESIGAPLAIAGWPAVARQSGTPHPLTAHARARLERLLTQFDLTGRWWTAEGPPALLSPRLHLTWWSPGWYAGVPLLPQTHHAGGVPGTRLPPDPGLPPPDAAPWVLITLGTSFADDPAFFVNAAQAADRLGCMPLLALGHSPSPAMEPWLARLPAAAVPRKLVDFAAVLPYAAAAIHHGGAGTTHALVTHAVPQVVVPHAADQVHQAQGVMRSGVGLHLPPKQATVDALTQALAALLPDLADHRRRAQALQAEFAQLGGIPTAADWLERSAS